MIYSRVRDLRHAKQEREGRKLTYKVMRNETGLSSATLVRLMNRRPLERIEASTLDALCTYFGVGIGEVLQFEPTEPNGANQVVGGGKNGQA